ncbi:hypothetical protein PPS11_23816 [Pseudomonas putida S11]|nr:hypothetical protein PPS11_23816 [Pseudomonas putida S11]
MRHLFHGIERRLQAQDGAAQEARVYDPRPCPICPASEASIIRSIPAEKMLAGTADHYRSHCIGVVDPLKDVDDLLPEGSVHRIALVRAVDLNVGDAVGQFDLECAVLGHGRHSCG